MFQLPQEEQEMTDIGWVLLPNPSKSDPKTATSRAERRDGGDQKGGEDTENEGRGNGP